MIVSVDGQLADEMGVISAADRAFLLGDGAFETMRVRDGAPIFFDRHGARLRVGLDMLGIAPPPALARAVEIISEVSGRNGCAQGAAVARLTVSRGAGPRGLAPVASGPARLVISVACYAQPEGVARLCVTRRRRLSTASFAGFKAIGGYVENMLARADATAQGADDGLLLNEHDRLIGASAANLFVLGADGVLRTPSVCEGALPGVTRALVLEDAAAMGLRSEEGRLAPEALAGAELILTNSLIGVRRARLMASGDVPPSDIFRALEACYARRIAAATGAPA